MTRDPILNLDDRRALEPAVVGAKAASLAAAKRAGLPVLDGLAIPLGASLDALAAGAEALEGGNSGLARARVTGIAMDSMLFEGVAEQAGHLGGRLVVRSSAPVESEGVWAGAFASYAELAPDEVALGVKGCWASVFAPDALGRAKASGQEPHRLGMAVLIQPEIVPDFGGVATVSDSGTVTIIATTGAPAAIVSGWERGVVAVVDGEGPKPEAASAEIGRDRLVAIADLARRTAALIGMHHIEWAEAEGRLWLLQAQSAAPRRPRQSALSSSAGKYDESDLSVEELTRLVDEEGERRKAEGRLGMTKWEPALFQAALSQSPTWEGEAAAGGWGAGRIRFIRDAGDAEHFRPREVLAAMYPLNNLAPLLWDAAGVVTIGGSPGAHLFEVAAWLGLPAVCGVDLEAAAGLAMDQLRDNRSIVAAVDGDAGTVNILLAGP